jgi:hypothetical protein
MTLSHYYPVHAIVRQLSSGGHDGRNIPENANEGLGPESDREDGPQLLDVGLDRKYPANPSWLYDSLKWGGAAHRCSTRLALVA